ncbi:MAG: hypothetical protein J2P18_09205, partial [Nocardia sp.]|nr:hypothetical protein [Nocardia sp.]
MTDLVTRGQLIILARILHKEPEDLAHLEYLGAQNLNQIQERMANLIYDQHQETFTRMARLIPLIPLTIWMPLVRRMVPANLTGRAAGPIATMHPKKAADVIKILGPEYGADVARYLDPRALPLLAAAADPVIVTGVVNEVLRRRDYVTVGPMLGYASQGLIESVERYVPDDEGLVRAAAYAYSAESVSRVLRQLLRGGQNRVPGMMRTVLQGPEDLQLATLSLIARCDTEPVAEMSEIIIEVGSRQELCDLVITAIRGQSVRELTVFFGKMSQKAQQVIAALPIFTDNSVVAALLR